MSSLIHLAENPFRAPVVVGLWGWPPSPAAMRELGRWQKLILSEGLEPTLVLINKTWPHSLIEEANAIFESPQFVSPFEVNGKSLDGMPFAFCSTDLTFATGPAIESVWEPFREFLLKDI